MMLDKKLIKTGLSALAISMAAAYAPASSAALSYSSDFESFTTGDIEDYVIGNIVNSGAGWFPGTYGAPGDYNNGYSAIVDEGGAAQGSQNISVFSDYNPWSPFTAGAGTTIETFVYRDVGLLDAGDIGSTYQFEFDSKLGNIDFSLSASEAFIKVIKVSDSSFIELANNTWDASNIAGSTDWAENIFIDLVVDAGMVGELVQIGWRTTATDYSSSAVYFDNVSVSAVPVPAAVWLFGSGVVGLIGVARRRKTS